MALGSGKRLMLDGVVHPSIDHVCSLGWVLDPALLLDKQVESAARRDFSPAVPLPRKEGYLLLSHMP